MELQERHAQTNLVIAVLLSGQSVHVCYSTCRLEQFALLVQIPHARKGVEPKDLNDRCILYWKAVYYHFFII